MFIVMRTIANFANINLLCPKLFSLCGGGREDWRIFPSCAPWESFTVIVVLYCVRYTLLSFLKSDRWWRSDIITLPFSSFLSFILKFWCLFQDYLTKIPILPWGGTQKGNQESMEFYKGIRKIYPLKSSFGGKEQKSNVFCHVLLVVPSIIFFVCS